MISTVDTSIFKKIKIKNEIFKIKNKTELKYIKN